MDSVEKILKYTKNKIMNLLQAQTTKTLFIYYFKKNNHGVVYKKNNKIINKYLKYYNKDVQMLLQDSF